MPSSHSHQFGPFRLDAGGRVLYRGADRVALTPKAVDLLVVLVQARGRPVAKDELLRTVWAGTVVEEGSLASHVSLLRKVLDAGGGEGFIETLPKRGYRFAGPVVEAGAEAEAPAPPPPPMPSPSPSPSPSPAAAHANAAQPPGVPADGRVRLAVQPFDNRGGAEAHDGFGDGLADEVLTQLARLGSPRLGVIAQARAELPPAGPEAAASHRLEGSVRRAEGRVRISARLVRLGDGALLWADSYERPLQDVLALQVDVAQAIVREVKGRLAPLRTLTFLFAAADSPADGPADGPASGLHDTLLREAIGRHGGHAFHAADGAFRASFPDAISAVLAAMDAQRALCAGAESNAVLPVRMGLHSGTVDDGEDDGLGGPTLARAARVMAAAQGGQILLTAATVALLHRIAPPGGEWRDLGDHTLRGFARPERLYQLSVAGLCADFPPIRTQEAMRTNLPPPLTAFVGRERALAQLRGQLGRARLVTLVGAGGTGKTRLGQEVAGQMASEFPDGAWLVELASVTGPALVPRAIAAALAARAEGDTSPLALIEHTLRGQRALLLLDNCEHLLDEVATVAHTLLRALPRLHLLATSRQALGVEGETVYRVPSLTLPLPNAPATGAELIACEAVRLFVDRAQAVRPGFALTDRNAGAVAQVCLRLDGIPLAIELAAARLTALSVEDIARRLDDRFHLLTGGLRSALPRQRTLRALVDWSYDLLPADERAVLDALSVFAGSFTLEAAERVAAGRPRQGSEESLADGVSVLDAVAQLVAKSLLIAETRDDGMDASDTRYRLLETIRQYAGEKLAAAGRADAVRRRHFDHCLALAASGAKALAGPRALEWLDRLEAEHDNLRAALDWSAGADAADNARLAAALRTFWDTRGHYVEGWARLRHALDAHPQRDAVRLELLIGAGTVAYRLADTQRSDDLQAEAITLAQQLGRVAAEAEATLWRAYNLGPQGADVVEPLILRGQRLARAAGDRSREALALLQLGRIAMERGQLDDARRLFLDSAAVFSDAGFVIEAPAALQYAGECALAQRDVVAARRLLDDALVQHRRIGNPHDAANTLALLAQLALAEQRLDDAHHLSAESLRTFRALHDPKCGARAALLHAAVLGTAGDDARALTHAESAAATYRELGFPLSLARALCAVGCIHARLGQGDAARQALFSGLMEQQRAERDIALPALLEAVAGIDPAAPAAAQLLGAAAAVRERLNMRLLPSEQADCERRHADVRAQHAQAAFEQAFAAGRTLSRDEAIRAALALQQPS
jgi:predicted ATPase/DNA-binding winged helix-turn-helix (wHTH) protein/TolB-like protein